MANGSDLFEQLNPDSEVERAAARDAESYAEAQRLVQQYREEGIPESDAATEESTQESTQEPQNPIEETLEGGNTQDPMGDGTTPRNPTEGVPSGSETIQQGQPARVPVTRHNGPRIKS